MTVTTTTGQEDQKGDVTAKTKILTNIEWGDGITEDNRKRLIEALKADTTLNDNQNDISKLVADTTVTPAATQSSAADVANAIANVVGADGQGRRTSTGEFFSSNEGDTAKAKIVAQILGKYATQNAKSFKENKNTADNTKTDNYTLTGLNPGYYLIQDAKDTQGTSENPKADGDYTRIILEVVGEETVKPKTGVPKVEKKVLDEHTSWQDTAIWGSQDTITYKLTGTLPDNFAEYQTYTTYTFTDTVTNGLDLLKSNGTLAGVDDTPAVKVLLHSHESTDTDFYQADGTLKTVYTDITNLFNVSTLSDTKYSATATDNNAKTFTVSLKTEGVYSNGAEQPGAVDLTKTYNIVTEEYEGHRTIGEVVSSPGENGETTEITFNKDANIIVVYTAKLNDSAVVGDYGNPNKVKLTYSNNPNVDHSGDKGETPEDEVTVFTLEIVPTKYKDSIAKGNGLSDATFLIYKTEAAKENVIGVGTSGEGGAIQFYEASAEEKDPEEKEGYYKVTINGTAFYVKNETSTNHRLFARAGTYVLSEIVTPDGYNTMSDITFTITATSGANTGNDMAEHPYKILTSNVSTGQQEGEASVLQFNDIRNGNEDTAHSATVTVSGRIEGGLINKKGSLLPSTGGIGTGFYYIVGSIFAAGAAGLLIMRLGK